MLKPSYYYSFFEAAKGIRSRLMHTLLSVLGIVIGVAALVVILSLIDGMEKFAKDQISKTTSLNSIAVLPELFKTNNNIRIRKKTYEYFTYDLYRQLINETDGIANSSLTHKESVEVHFKNRIIGAEISGTSNISEIDSLAYGSVITDQEIKNKKNIGYINHYLAAELSGGMPLRTLIGNVVEINDKKISIKGILPDQKEKFGQLTIPITLVSDSQFQDIPPVLVLNAPRIEDVEPLKLGILTWMKRKNMNAADFILYTNAERVAQVTKGFMLFRLVMGFIVGLSVIVGGVGVMNVLIISIIERTAEIGIRKAVGANKAAIMTQFLAESVTISSFGSLVGLLLGLLITVLIIPAINNITGLSFTAAYTMQTLSIVPIAAIVIGIVFGTYPALKAAKLDPVEAIRKE